jgi:hypothetical protein
MKEIRGLAKNIPARQIAEQIWSPKLLMLEAEA